MTVMSNVGAAIYLYGKQKGALFGLGSESFRIPVQSPRTGIIQIGEGLFHPRFSINRDQSHSVANSWGRISVFAHEARHSDGNGKSLSFVHGICPSGDYQGYAACDRSTNGPYTVGALLLKRFAEQCKDCSPAEREKLRLMSADSFSRIIPPLTEPVPSPLSTEEQARIQSLMSMVELLISLTNDPKEKAEYQAKLEDLRKRLHPEAPQVVGTPAKIPELDPRPEGVGLFK